MNALEPRKTSPFAFSLRILTSLKNSSYRLYLFVTIAHFAAMSMQMFTSPLLIYRLTGSTALLGTMSLVSSAPMIIVSIFGGAIADRVSKKKIMITALIGLAVVSTLIGLSLSSGMLSREHPESWWMLFVASAIQGCIMGLMMPALQAIIPEIVDRDQLMNAIALNSMGMNVLQLLSPAIAGPIIDRFNFQAVYFSMTGLYLVGALLVVFITARKQIVAGGTRIMADIQQGFQYIRKDSMILLILFFTLVVTVLAMPYQQFLPVFYDDILKIGATGGGLLMSVSGVGALVGSLILATLPNKKRGIMLLASGILSGVALVIFSFSSHLYLSLIVIFFIGLAQTFRMTIGSALVQAYTQGAYMGRVMSILNMQWGFMSLCTFLAGIIAEKVNVQWVLGSLAMILIAISLVFIIFTTNIRKVE